MIPCRRGSASRRAQTTAGSPSPCVKTAQPVNVNAAVPGADATEDADRYVWGAVTLQIQDVPDPVTGVTVTGFADRTVTVAWAPGGFNNSPITGYKVTATRGDGSEFSARRLRGHQRLRHPHAGQRPGVNGVRISVIAQNAIGRSEPASIGRHRLVGCAARRAGFGQRGHGHRRRPGGGEHHGGRRSPLRPAGAPSPTTSCASWVPTWTPRRPSRPPAPARVHVHADAGRRQCSTRSASMRRTAPRCSAATTGDAVPPASRHRGRPAVAGRRGECGGHRPAGERRRHLGRQRPERCTGDLVDLHRSAGSAAVTPHRPRAKARPRAPWSRSPAAGPTPPLPMAATTSTWSMPTTAITARPPSPVRW